jgi:sugar phosphate isomerase/epimerase
LNDLLAQTHLNLNYCFDAGHAHIGNGIAKEFELMKERIRSTHVHDNDSKDDLHLFPNRGTIDWRATMALLRSRADQYPLLLELKAVAGLEHPAEEAKRAADDLDRLSE